MRANTLLRRMLGITGIVVDGFEFEGDDLVVDVRSRGRRRPRCGLCGVRAPGYDSIGQRKWRHLGIGGLRIWIRSRLRRVNCARCGVRVESVPWAAHNSGFTLQFEELAAYLARATDKTTVRRLLGVAWRTVGRIVERVVARNGPRDVLEGLRRIGVDEFSYRKRHRYLTVIVDHDTGRVVWAAPGPQYETLRQFFEVLGPERCAEIELVTIDMNAGFKKAIAEFLPKAQVVFDRFHVQRLASDALDEVRREQLRETRGTPEGRSLFRSRFVLLKNPWNLSRRERAKLSNIEKHNAPLFRAYLLKEAIVRALDYVQPWRAKRALKEWIAWASRSRLGPFQRVARTIRKHFDGVLAYIGERLTNGIVEGINNRMRMVSRRAFGFHSPEPLIALLRLCCGRVPLDPPIPVPTDV
ncbi:MAG: ISL3 family transposase [Candidatus Eisenbacteria bacterium]|uniref:ISL3 family transposase n=1 Tax=Eiseniibacteriota bacterium TaxID=2212470 RepID=A0A956M3A0_UNCEI|nr:ISL3 family transposase [Candidatus Eisenbacteria bacterium]